MHRWSRAGMLVAAVVLLPGALGGRGDPWERQVSAALERAVPLMAARGYRPTTARFRGALAGDQVDRLPLALEPGEEYLIVGVCDADCGELVLVLARDGGYEIDAARGSAVPMVRVTPEARHAYNVRVAMGRCREAPCRYGIGVFQRGVRPPLHSGKPAA